SKPASNPGAAAWAQESITSPPTSPKGGHWLAVNPVQLRLGVVTAHGRGEPIESGQLTGSEFDRIGAYVFLKARNAFGSRNGHDLGTLRQQPSQRDLSRGRADVGTDVTQLVGTAEVVGEVLREESGIGLAVVVVGQFLGGSDCAGEEATAER